MSSGRYAREARWATVLDTGVALLAAWCLVEVLRLVFAPSPVSARAPRATRVGELRDLGTEVRRRSEGSLVWEDLAAHAHVYRGDALYVPSDGFAHVALDGGGQLRIEERSLVIIDIDAGATGTVAGALALDVRRGGAQGDSASGPMVVRGGGTTVQLEADAAVRLRVDGEAAGEATVSRGEAKVAGASGAGARLRGGERKRWRDGESNTSPLVVTLNGPPPFARVFRPDLVPLSWSGGRGPFEVLVQRGARITAAARRWRTSDEHLEVPDLSPGVYAWQVRSASGESEERTFVVARRPVPMMYVPRAEAIVDLSDANGVALAWTEERGALGYRVQVANGEDFSAPRLDEKAPLGMLRASSSVFPQEGRYCARARVELAAGEMPWSTARCFRVVLRPVLRAPELFDPETEPAREMAPRPRGSLWWPLFGAVAHAAPDPGGGRPAPLTLRWEAIAGAIQYQLEISTSAAFADVVVRTQVPNNVYRFEPPAQGRYHWRVRAVDAQGRLGLLSEPRTLDLVVPVPSLVSPPADARFHQRTVRPSVTLKWRVVPEARSYRVEIARAEDFVQRDARSSEAAELVFTPPDLGAYHWRVAAVDADGVQSAFCPPRRFELQVAAPSTRASEPRIALTEHERVTLAWEARPVARYEVQIGVDPTFSAAPTGHSATSAHLEVELAPGVHHWRVRGVAPSTAWSAPAVVELRLAAPVLEAVRSEGSDRSVLLRWASVAGATGYRVLVLHEDGREETHESAALELALPLPSGRYAIAVQARAGESLSDASPRQTLDVSAARAPPGKAAAAPLVVQTEPVVRDRLQIDPRIALYTNFAGVVAPRVGVGVAARLPWWSGCARVELSASYYPAASAVQEQGVDVRAQLHAVPIALGVWVEIPAAWLGGFEWLVFSAGAAASATVTAVTLQVSGQPERLSAAVLPGGRVGLMAEKYLGPGALFVDVVGEIGLPRGGAVALDPSGLQVALGYRFSVW